MQFSDSKESRQQTREGILSGVENAPSYNEVDYEQVLENLGFGKTQWILLLISGLLTVHSMATQTSVGIIAIASQCEFGMSQAEKGVMMAACVAGICISTYFWGYISDAFGRRSVLLYGTFVTVLLQFISMFVTNIWVFNFINLFMGICLGGISGSLYAYLSEFNTVKYRAIVINYSTMFVSIAAIYMPATCWLVLSADWSLSVFDGFTFRPWRLIILLNFLPGLIGGLMLLPFPESPKLLLAQDKEEEAIAAVEWISKFNASRSVKSLLHTESYKLKPEEIGDEDLLRQRCGCGVLVNILKATVPLFHKPHGTNFMISAVAMFGLFFSSGGMQVWYPEISNRQDGSVSTVCKMLDESFRREYANASMVEERICDTEISTQTYIDNMIVGVAFLIGFAIQGALLNPLGRKNVLLATLVFGVFSGILLHFVANSTAILVLFCLYILMPGLAISVMCGAIVDLVPTHLRGKAVSICLTMGRLGIIVSTNFIAVMLEPACNTTFGIVTASILVCGVLVFYLPI